MPSDPVPLSADSAPDTVAAIDLGSNSFHMIVARIADGDLQVIDRLKEMVRLAAGLTDDKQLRPEASERALACLERFGQRVRGMPPGSVRAVGTNTLRQVRPETGFLERAEQALGHPIDVIAGREEARLIYLGVANGLAAGDDSRLVVDIGGGSTELIVGEGFTPRLRESLHMGCVSMSRSQFPDGKITAKLMDRAELS
jgi:exopolyphosphatase/guanosine-5'-triphosphate,3'-diphosphate pyrophosphatase